MLQSPPWREFFISECLGRWAWEGGGGCLARGARGGAGRSHHQNIKRENSFRIIRREAGNGSTRETGACPLGGAARVSG